MTTPSRKLELWLAIAAILIGIVPLVTTDVRVHHIIGGVIAAALLIAALIVFLKKQPQLDPDAAAMKFSLTPATADDIAWVAGLEEKQFRSDAVPLAILREWFGANPNGFVILRDRHGKRIGHIDVLAVRPEAFELFVKGTITEQGLRAASLYGAAERANVRDLYVESVVVQGGEEHRAAVSYLLTHVEDGVFARVAEPANIRHVYGLAATGEGRNFMERKGFEVVSEADKREDGHPLYRIDYATLKQRL
ncbi:MAG TPA: hypothetical protein VJ276_02830 [Thermoanaerobaculia bacterium]|nr:hypothetical protein [Thermoanaerobaculia bacterium]